MSSTGDGDQDGRNVPHPTDDRLKERLRTLERKLQPSPGEGAELTDSERARRGSLLGMAFRMSTELVAGVFVGGAMGWLLDGWLGTRFLFVVFLLLGIAAGLLNAVREARKMSGI
jgi:ATP synthase protein I